MMKNNKGNTALKIIIGIIAVIVIIVVSLIVGANLYKKYIEKQELEKRITSAEVSEKLEGMSDLTTEKLIYNGVIHYEEGSIPLIDKKSYNMVYEAEVESGIDITQVKVTDNGEKIIIEVPDAEVQSIYVNPDSIQFYDESYAIFNWDDKQDGVDAVKNAENDVKEKANIEALNEQAEKHAKELIENLFHDYIGEQEVEVR